MKQDVALLILLLAALLACGSSSATQVRGPDGSDNWWSIECKKSQENCYEEAGETCPNGYDVADNHGRDAGYVSTGTMIVPVYKGSMLIRCKDEGK